MLFFSPDCDECVRSEPLISQLQKRQGWGDVMRLDARRVSSLSVRARFDAAFRVPDHLRGHTPALFHSSGAVIGYDQFHAARLSGLPPSKPGQAASTFPWGEWANLVIIGLCLLVMAGTLGHRAPQSRLAGVLLLAAIFLISGIGKVLAPAAFVQTVEQMNLFPLPLARAAWLLGPMEVVLGAALLLPRRRRAALAGGALLLAGFTSFTVLLVGLDHTGDCGCMPWKVDHGIHTVMRNCGLFIMCCGLYACGKGNRLNGPEEAVPAYESSHEHGLEPAKYGVKGELTNGI